MKKFIAILLVAATMVLCLTGCFGKKATAVVTFDDDASVTALPVGGIKNIGVQVNENVMEVNMGKEGVYAFPVMVNGNVYNFTITYANGQINVEADEGLTFTVK